MLKSKSDLRTLALHLWLLSRSSRSMEFLPWIGRRSWHASMISMNAVSILSLLVWGTAAYYSLVLLHINLIAKHDLFKSLSAPFPKIQCFNLRKESCPDLWAKLGSRIHLSSYRAYRNSSSYWHRRQARSSRRLGRTQHLKIEISLAPQYPKAKNIIRHPVVYGFVQHNGVPA